MMAWGLRDTERDTADHGREGKARRLEPQGLW